MNTIKIIKDLRLPLILKLDFFKFLCGKLKNEIQSDSNFDDKNLNLIKCHFPEIISDEDKKKYLKESMLCLSGF